VKKTRKYNKNGNDYTETYRYPQATVKFPFKKPTAADLKGLQYHEIDNYATTNVTFQKKSKKHDKHGKPIKIVKKATTQ